ncbi:MAG: hypothetical protein ABSH06_24200 [Thermodesulfobacteriota bacterium]
MKSVEQQKYWNPVIETLLRERLMEIELKCLEKLSDWLKRILLFIGGNSTELNVRISRLLKMLQRSWV